MNPVRSKHDAAAPGAEGESSNVPFRVGDRSPSPASGRSAPENPNGGGPSPSGGKGGSPDPREAGWPIKEPVKDALRKPLSVAQAPTHDSSETVAPDVAQVVRVLQKLEDLLRTNQVGPELERESEMSRVQMEQFVTRFKRLRNAAPGQGRAVEVEPGHERAFNDNPTSTALDRGTVGNLATRSSANVVDDRQRDNVEGSRPVVPSALQSGFEAYKSSLSHATATPP
jgi:hypothetical protein